MEQQLIAKLDTLTTMLTLLVAEQTKLTAALHALADAIAAPVDVPDDALPGGDGVERDFNGNPVR